MEPKYVESDEVLGVGFLGVAVVYGVNDVSFQRNEPLQAVKHSFGMPKPALPYSNDMPTLLAQSSCHSVIPSTVVVNFFMPEFLVCFGKRCSVAVDMIMPKTAMYKYYTLGRMDNKIGRSGEGFHISAKPKTKLAKNVKDQTFG